VVTNLLDNAVKYTPPGGHVTLRVGARDGLAEVEVADDGTGIPRDLLPRIFDLFTQGERTIDRSQGGLGLGLALVRRIVELHGGQVTARSEGTGRGASFRVSLPLEAPPVPEAASPAHDEEAERKLKILIVEDNPDGRETLVMMLGMQGHDVHAAEDGPGGVQEALQWHPDAAIVDIGLPGFDGYEVARRIRAAAKGVAIRLVALTGYGQEEDRRQALAAGFDSFLVKPADFRAIHSILATV
jgi:CheY-like chemotaxis protein